MDLYPERCPIVRQAEHYDMLSADCNLKVLYGPENEGYTLELKVGDQVIDCNQHKGTIQDLADVLEAWAEVILAAAQDVRKSIEEQA